MSDEIIIAETFKKFPIFKRFEKIFIKALIEALEKKDAEMRESMVRPKDHQEILDELKEAKNESSN